MTAVRRDVAVVLAVQAVATALVVGWFATGHASAPDDGLLQLDVLSMDVWLGHIAIHTGPSPVLVALGSLLLGGWAHIAVTVDRRRLAVPLALGALVLVVVACVLARPLPTTLAEFPTDSAPVVHTG